MIGGGPYVKTSAKLILNPTHPIDGIVNDCAACTAHFLGFEDKIINKLSDLAKSKKSVELGGITDNQFLNSIRQYENIERKKGTGIEKDLGTSYKDSYDMPTWMYYKIISGTYPKDKVHKFYDNVISWAFEHIPRGYATIMKYDRIDSSGHYIVLIKGSNGSYNLVDSQYRGNTVRKKRQIHGYFTYNQIVSVTVFKNGLLLKENSDHGSPKKDVKESAYFPDLVLRRQISTESRSKKKKNKK